MSVADLPHMACRQLGLEKRESAWELATQGAARPEAQLSRWLEKELMARLLDCYPSASQRQSDKDSCLFWLHTFAS